MDTQQKRCEAFISAKGWVLAGDYCDPGISGTTANRPGLQALLSDAKAGKFDVVAVYKLDRLARRQLLALQLVSDLGDCGVGLVSTTEAFDTVSSFGRAGLGMATTFAQLERDLIAERTLAGRNARHEAGGWAGGFPPFGYQYDSGSKGVTVVEKEADVVRLIFREYTSRQVGLRQVAKQLNDLGIPPRGKGLGWRSQAVRAILVSESYTGRHRVGTVCPALVSKAVFEEAQRRLSGNKHLHPPRVAPWLLQSRMRCGLCGAMLRCTYSHKLRFYECPRRRASEVAGVGEICTLPRYKAEYVEGLVVAHLVEQLADSDKAQAMADSQIRLLQERLTTMEAAHKPVTEQPAEVDAKLGRLSEAYIFGHLDKERLLRLQAGLEAERERLQAQEQSLDPSALSRLEFARDQLQVWRDRLRYAFGAPQVFVGDLPEADQTEWKEQWLARARGETDKEPFDPSERFQGKKQGGALSPAWEIFGGVARPEAMIERLQVVATVFSDRIQLDGLMPLGDVQLGVAETSPSCR